MSEKVLVKLTVVIPYGGGLDNSLIMSIPYNKYIGTNSMFTINRSPHGNKTARDQFKTVDTKYSFKVILDNISNVEGLLAYTNVGAAQGIDNQYVQPKISYIVKYSILVK